MTDYTPGSGVCKCGMIMMSINGEKPKCVDCDFKDKNVPSGLVVTVKDPGHDKMQAILKNEGIDTVENKDTKTIITPDCITISFSLDELLY